MAAFPIAGVTLGNWGAVGSPSVANVTKGFLPLGWDSARVGNNAALGFPGQEGNSVHFPFDQPYGFKPPPNNVEFTNGGDKMAGGLSVGSTAGVGFPTIRNTARQFWPSGIAPPAVPTPRAYDGALLGGAASFLFDDGYDNPNPLNTPFYFGDGDRVVTGAGGISTGTVGQPLEVRNTARKAWPIGIPPPPLVPTPRAGFYGPVEFKFVGPYTPGNGFTPFYFGDGGRLVLMQGTAFVAVGSPTVRNSAKQALPQGIPPPGMGKTPKVYRAEANGVGVDFVFAQDYSIKRSPLNIPFYFAWSNYAQIPSQMTLEFGVPTVWNYNTPVTGVTVGDTASFGKFFIENWAEFAVVPVGLNGMEFGRPTVEIRPGFLMSMDGSLSQVDTIKFYSSAAYITNTERPTVNASIAPWQVSTKSLRGTTARHQVSGKRTLGPVTGFQAADRLHNDSSTPSQGASRVARTSVTHEIIQATGHDISSVSGFQSGTHTDVRQSGGWQVATPLQTVALYPHQEASRELRFSVEGKHQTATRVSRSLVASMQKAKANPLAWLGPFQDAKQPEVGQSFAPTPPVPPVIPCYRRELPLHFKVLIADQALSFVCDTYVAPPKPDPVGLITIPVQKVYLTMNEVRLFKVTGNVELPVIALSLNIDMDSWSWGFSATLPGDTLPLLWTGASNSPVSLEAKVNGQSYYLLAEKVSRSRSHGKTSISVSGRGHSAWLSSPYAPSMSFTSGEGVTAQHLMNDALKTNGVSIGWDIDWGILDWYVPGGVWSTTGSYIDAVTNIARSVGAYVSPHKTLQKLAIKARYPALPWTWASATPDIILPADVVSTESVQWSEKPSYDSVYVSGVSDGVLGFVKRAGTAGDKNAPMVTDALITHADAARMRGAAILADTGIVSTISLSLPVLALTGVIEPGKLIRYTEGARSTLGLTKSVSVSMTEQSKLSQTIELEVHG